MSDIKRFKLSGGEASELEGQDTRFQFLMEQFIPQWQVHRAALNELPVRHENWAY